MRLFLLPLFLLISGCAHSLGDFSRQMNELVGQPVQTAFARLGYPDRQEEIAGNTVYYWGTDQPVGASCTFKIVASKGIVESWDGYGNAAGCGSYVRDR